MGGIGALGGGNPLGGLGAAGGMGGGAANPLAGLPGMGLGDAGIGTGGQGGSEGAGGFLGGPNASASPAQGASFGDTLKSMVVEGPSASKKNASDLMARFAAGENIDPHQLSVASAKAGVEIQMATRTISSTVSAVRTLFQMQI